MTPKKAIGNSARAITGSIPMAILAVLKAHPDGISLPSIARALKIPLEQQIHFNRRLRDLYPEYIIEKRRERGVFLYSYKGPRAESRDTAAVSKSLRAQVLHSARGKCQMCGRTVTNHSVVLVVDHKFPRDWGGRTTIDNLWALCSECNEGKRAFFSSIDSPETRAAMGHASVHVRIGELLKAYLGKPVPSSLLAVVANQEDWNKRLRELRYLGWRIRASKKKLASGRVESSYSLLESKEWPEDPTGVIRAYEIERRRRNREK